MITFRMIDRATGKTLRPIATSLRLTTLDEIVQHCEAHNADAEIIAVRH